MSGGAIEVGSSSESSKPECYISRSMVVYTILLCSITTGGGREMWCSKRRRRSRRRLQRRLGLLQVVSVQPCAAWKSELPYFSTIYTSLIVYTRDLIDRSSTIEYIYLPVNCCVSHPYPEQRPLVYFFPCLIIRSGKKFGGN